MWASRWPELFFGCLVRQPAMLAANELRLLRELLPLSPQLKRARPAPLLPLSPQLKRARSLASVDNFHDIDAAQALAELVSA